MKLQNAYITEAAAMGNYTTIGYEMATTTNFDYTEPSASWSNGTLALPTSNAKVALNNCKQNSEWSLFIQKDTSGSGAVYEGGIGDGAAATAGTFTQACVAMTAGFKTISDNN